jgi:hypothetical protein
MGASDGVNPDANSKGCVNARNFEPDLLKPLRVSRLDGASSWKYLAEGVGEI